MAVLRITALEGEHAATKLEAEFNPSVIALERAIVWERQAHKGPGDLHFERAEPARLSFEIQFQETTSVQPHIDTLQQLCAVDGALHRPPKVEVSWGSAAGALPRFDGVIVSISLRYVQFADSGVPLRATAAVTLEQAVHLSA